MAPYMIRESAQSTMYTSFNNSNSATACPYENNGWQGFTAIREDEDLSLPFPKEKPYFDRVMKMRNTGGRLFKPMVWKPIRG